MYKVVIIDDEPIIVEGLSKAVPWEKWDCYVAATAESGQSGVENYSKKKIQTILFFGYQDAGHGRTCDGERHS